MVIRDPNRGRDVSGRLREADRNRPAALHTCVACVERELERLGPGAVIPECGLEVGDECAVIVDERRIPICAGYPRRRAGTRVGDVPGPR